MSAINIPVRALLVCAATLLLGLALAGCGDTATATTAPQPTATTATTAPQPTATTATSTSGDSGGAIAVSLFEWGIEPKNIEATAGKQSFNVVNKGKFPHNFAIEVSGTDQKTPNLAANGTATLDTALPAGTYKILCAIPGHAEQGMVGTLIVK